MAPSSEKCKIAGLSKDLKEITCGMKFGGKALLLFYQDIIKKVSRDMYAFTIAIKTQNKISQWPTIYMQLYKETKEDGFSWGLQVYKLL